MKIYLWGGNFKSIHLCQYLKQTLFSFCTTLDNEVVHIYLGQMTSYRTRARISVTYQFQRKTWFCPQYLINSTKYCNKQSFTRPKLELGDPFQGNLRSIFLHIVIMLQLWQAINRYYTFNHFTLPSLLLGYHSASCTTQLLLQYSRITLITRETEISKLEDSYLTRQVHYTQKILWTLHHNFFFFFYKKQTLY